MALVSPLEACFSLHLQATKLPKPTEEFMFAKEQGRKWRADFAWPDRKILVEIDGGTYAGGRHTRAAGYEADCEKVNAATALGYRVFRFTARQVKSGEAIKFMEWIFSNLALDASAA